MADPARDPAIEATPYWWVAAPPFDPPVVALPASADVAIVGAGYAGLTAAIRLARGGRSVLVCDAEAAGWGASSRSQGQIGAVFKRDFGHYESAYGTAAACAIFREGQEAVAFVQDLIAREGIECHLEANGRVVLAYTPTGYEALARELEVLRRHIGFEADMLPRAEQHREVGTDFYYGGQIRHRDANLHPALFHKSLLDRAREAGVRIAAHTPVTGIRREGDGFEVATTRGRIKARDVIVATNGYTGAATPDLRRRVVPIGAYCFATERLAPELIAQVLPKRRAFSDTAKLVLGFRHAPDAPRLIFGGRASLTETDPRRAAPRVYRRAVEVFPALDGVGVSHTWTGFVGFTFQYLPHIGVRDGVHYALGCCGSGIAMQPHLGNKLAGRILGANDTATAFDALPFATRPFYFGKPWFLGPVLWGYRWLDARARWPG